MEQTDPPHHRRCWAGHGTTTVSPLAVRWWVGDQGPVANGTRPVRAALSDSSQDTNNTLEGGTQFPHSQTEFERTTRCEWRKAHTDTGAFIGPKYDHPPIPITALRGPGWKQAGE